MKKIDPKHFSIVQYAFIFITSFLVYSNTLKNDFALDDTMVLTENKYTQGGWEGFKKIIQTDAFEGFLGEGKNLLPGGRYRPLSQLIFNIEYKYFHLHAFNYHLINISLFSFVMMMLFYTLNLLLVRFNFPPKLISVAFITTLITALHPIHTEVVANIKSLDLILALLFCLLIIIQALKFVDDGKKYRLLYVFIFFVFGMFSKENVLTMLAAIPLVLIYFRKPKWSNVFITLIPIFLGLLTYFAIRFSFLGKPPVVVVNELLNDPFLYATSGQRIATVIYTWFVYFKLLILPINLTHDYYPFVIGYKEFTDPIVLITTILLILGIVWSIKKFIDRIKTDSKPNIYAFGLSFFLIVFSASSNLLVNIGAFMNERFVFIADIGLFLAFSWFLFEYLPTKFQKMPKNLPTMFISIVLVLFSIKVISRNMIWHDDYKLFTTDAKVSFNSAKCNVSAGGKSYEKAIENKTDTFDRINLLNDAVNYLKKGISIHPKYFQAYWMLGNVYFEQNIVEQSFISYKQALEITKNPDVINNVRNLALKAKLNLDYNSTINILNYLKTIQYNAEYDYHIADSYMLMIKIDSAISVLNQAIKRDSTYEESYNKLGEIYGKHKNDFQLSRLFLMKAFEINPRNSSVLENLGVLNGIIGNYKESLNFFMKALELKPNNKQLLINISVSYGKLNDKRNAELYLQKAATAN